MNSLMIESTDCCCMERVVGLEALYPSWQILASVLPNGLCPNTSDTSKWRLRTLEIENLLVAYLVGAK